MTSRLQFALILICPLVIASFVSHLAVETLHFTVNEKPVTGPGTNYHSAPIICAGSSMIGVAIDWTKVSNDLERPVRLASSASASPSELEMLVRRFPDATLTVIGVSAYELDDQIIADHRADIVPLNQSVVDLWDTKADWAFSKRILSRYPRTYLQSAFPTAGYSLAVMVGIRAKLNNVLAAFGKKQNETVTVMNEVETNALADWDEGRLLRNVSEIRSASHEAHSFNGPKHRALIRMCNAQAKRGKVFVIVLPVSPPYLSRALTDEDKAAFEKSLEDVRGNAPDVTWVRLDQMPEFATSAVFADLIHLNAAGRRLATAVFRAQLAATVKAS